MAAKALLLICAQIFLAQGIFSHCAPYGSNAFNGLYRQENLLNAPYGGMNGAYGANLLNSPYAPFNAVASAAASNGALPVASSSPLPANGVSVLSENRIEGPLACAGKLPFLGTVAVEGPLPTVGAGAVAFGAGNGNVGITREDASYGYGRFGAFA